MLVLKETPIPEVCEAFKVARGMVQALQESAGRFASMVSVFCERLGWHDLEGLVAKFQNRVSFGVRAEIVELTTIPYVKVRHCPSFIWFYVPLYILINRSVMLFTLSNLLSGFSSQSTL